MELSSIEISLLSQRIAEALQGYFLSGIYSIEGGVLLRFNHQEKSERLVALSSFAPWLTTKNLSQPVASKFVGRIRDRIERTTLLSTEQVGNERIVRFSFVNRSKEKLNLYSEFFAHGNLILTDESKDDSILEVENPQEFRHRKLMPGEKYILPPARGLPLQSVNDQNLLSMFRESLHSPEEEKIPLLKWFGRKVGTSRKFVEEIAFNSGIDTNQPMGRVDEKSIIALGQASIQLVEKLQNSSAGYILIPSDYGVAEPDVCPMIPRAWEEMVGRKLAAIQSYANLSDALDEVQIQSLIFDKQRRASAETRAKAEELASAIAKQQTRIDWNKETSTRLREFAKELNAHSADEIRSKIGEYLIQCKLVEEPIESKGKLRFVNTPRSFTGTYSNSALASRLYDEAKTLESAIVKMESVMADLKRKEASLVDKTRSQEERESRKIITERRERQWYERYRWFYTSDGRLSVGGRDATSNSVIVNKHLAADDAVFHADLHGSPFFVLANGGIRENPDDELALELAQATVSFSRAWKDELGSADAYWVFGDQVSKSAPSGEYLSRGSFFIEGKKNLIRHLKVELSIGLAIHLPHEILDGADRSETATVVCGPEKAISSYCVSKVRISPGKEKASEFAKRVKQMLVSGVKDQVEKEIAKKITIDEIIRVLPSGGFRVVLDKHQEY